MSEDGQTASTTGDATQLTGASRDCDGYIARLTAAKKSGTNPTLDAKVEHSPTGEDDTWVTLLTFDQVTTEVLVLKEEHVPKATTLIFPYVRAVTTLGGTDPNYDVDVDIYHE